MNRILFLLGLMLSGLLVSCSPDAPRYTIGVSQCSDDTWRHKMNDEIQREALFYGGVKVETRTAHDDSRRQIEDIRYFIRQKVDLLIVAANEGMALTPVVEEAFDKGIPVIMVDRRILSDKYTAYIGADNYELGKAVGNYIAHRLKRRGKVVELSGLVGSTPAIERHQGFMSAISQYPDMTLLASEDAGWLQQPAEAKMDSLCNVFRRSMPYME